MSNFSKKIKLFFAIAVFSAGSAIRAQIVVFADSTATNQLVLNECGKSDTFTTYLRVVTGALTGSVVYSDTLPSGFVISGVLSNPSVSSYSGLGTNVLTANLASPLNPGNTPIRIAFLVRAKCGTNGLFSAVHKMKLTASGFSNLTNGKDFVSSIKAPTIILEARANNQRPNATVGSVHTRVWRIRNTGTNSEVDTVWFRVIHQAGTIYSDLEVNGVMVAPTLIHGDTLWYRNIQVLRNQSSFPADTVFIRESFIVSGCTDPSSSSLISAYWGCLSSPVCDYSELYASTQIPNTVPDIKVKLMPIQYGCYGSYDTITVAFYNSGNGPASQVKLRLDLCYPNEAYTYPDNSDYSYFDTASIRVKTGAAGTYVHQVPDSSVSYGFSRSFWPAANPSAIFYLKRNLLKSGDTLFVQVRRFRGIYTDVLCTGTDNFLNYTTWYKNQCGTASYFGPKTNIAGESHRYYGKTAFNGPAYLYYGDTGTFEFTTQRGASFSSHYTSGIYMMTKLELPAGLKWDGDVNGLKLSRLGTVTTWAADSVYYNTSTRVLEAYYKNKLDVAGLTAKPRLILDCTGSSGSQNIFIQYFMVRPVTACGFQMLPLSCHDAYPVTLICPGPCPRGGVSPYFAQMKRVNFGLPDNNSDGVPDPSGSVDMSKVEWNKLAPRDTFRLTYKGIITRGVQSPSANFVYGYGRVWIPLRGDLISALSASITVKDQSAGTSFTVNNLSWTKLDTSTRRTFVFDYSGNQTGFPSGFYYDHGDSFVFTASFIFNQNVLENANADEVVTTSNSFYVSHLANPVLDSARYRCLDLPSNYRIVNVYKGYNGGFVARPVGCTQVAVYSDYFQSVGDCCANYAGSMHFPFEYRLFTTLDTIRIKIPNGYTLDSTRLIYNYTKGAGVAGGKTFSTAIPISVSGEWYTFLLTPYYTISGGTTVPSTTGSYWQMYNYIRASCAIPSGDIKTQYTADRWTGRNTWTGITTRGVATNHNRGTYEYQGAAQLDMANSGATTVQGINRTVSWDFNIQNNAIAATANNVWISGRSPDGKISVDSIRDLPSNLLLVKTGSIFKSGDLASAGAIRSFRVYASYTACTFDSLILYSGWNCTGYPATLSSTNGSCRSDSIRVYLSPLNALVQTDLVSQPADPSNLCDTLSWVLSVSSRQVATAYNLNLDVIVPDAGVGGLVVPTYRYKYPYNASSWQAISPVTISPGIYRFYLSDSIAAIKNNGLRPIAEAPYNELLLQVRMVTNCNFTSGSNVRFVINSQKACGVQLPPDAEFDPVNISGAPAARLLVLGTITPGITTCDSQFTMEITLHNYEAGSSSSNDQLWATLPAGTYYVPGSINFVRNPFTSTTPVVDTIGGKQRLKWVANGLPGYDSTVIRLKYYSPSNISCGGNSLLSLQAVSKYTATCATVPGGVCNTFVENNRLEQDRPVHKPALNYVSGTGTARIAQDTTVGNKYASDSIVLSGLQFDNSGIATADNPLLTLFVDANNNNQQDPGENTLFADTLAPILPVSSVLYSKIIVFGHKTLPASSRIKLTITQKCNCTNTKLIAAPPSFYVPLETEWGMFLATVNAEKAVSLNWSTLSESGSSHFVVERKPAESAIFIPIATVQAAGNSYQPLHYSYLDHRTLGENETMHYRIVLYGQNNSSSFSPVRAVSHISPGAATITFYPNPADLFLGWSDAGNELSEYTIFDAYGRACVSGTMMGKNGTIDLKNLNDGIYFIRVFDGEIVSTTKFCIRK